MKKLIGTAMLAALLATSAFAEISFGMWLCQVWAPVAYDDGDVLTGIQNPWGESHTIGLGVNWVSEDERAGMSFSIESSPWWKNGYELKYDEKAEDFADRVKISGGLPVKAGDNNFIWVKPWDWLKLTLGAWDNAGGTDITSVNTVSWDWLRPGTWLAGDSHLYSENQATGALFQITPLEDLYIAVGLPFTNPDMAYHMFEALVADVAYTVPDVLKVMVGWRGGRYDGGHRDNFAIGKFKDGSDFMNVGEVDIYASLLAVENLQLEVGARVNILNSDYSDRALELRTPTDEKPLGYGDYEGIVRPSALIGLKAGYNITDRFSIKADFAVATYKDAKYKGITGEHKPDFQFGVGVGVGLTDSLSLAADFRGLIKGDITADGGISKSSDPIFSFLVGLNYACSSNANIGIGFQGKVNGTSLAVYEYSNYIANDFGFAVPIRVNVWF